MKKRLGKFLRDKLGITGTRTELTERLRFLSTYVNTMLPDRIELSSDVRKFAEIEIESRYGIKAFNAVIHKNDLMFQHHLRKLPHKAPEAVFHYFNVGLDALSKIRSLWGNRTGPVRILDFGAGYGRGSRFLPYFFPEAQISVSEVKKQAMSFQAREFGFRSIHHSESAGSFTGQDFNLIIAISVFSHLPAASSQKWLQKLWSVLEPGGILIFTYYNTDKLSLPHEDYQFISQSEDGGMPWVSDRIEDSSLYGSAFYSESHITAVIMEATGVEPEIIRGFSGDQDAAVLRKIGERT